MRLSASASRTAEIGAAPYQKHCSDSSPAEFELGMIEQHVDHGRRQEGVRDAVALDQIEKLGDVGVMHDDDATAERHDRETQHAGRVGQRREREVDRTALERIAHQRQCRHGLDVAARQHDPLRLAGGAPGAGNHREIVDSLALIMPVGEVSEPAVEGGGEG